MADPNPDSVRSLNVAAADEPETAGNPNVITLYTPCQILADSVRRLVAEVDDDGLKTAAGSLLTELGKRHDPREKVYPEPALPEEEQIAATTFLTVLFTTTDIEHRIAEFDTADLRQLINIIINHYYLYRSGEINNLADQRLLKIRNEIENYLALNESIDHWEEYLAIIEDIMRVIRESGRFFMPGIVSHLLNRKYPNLSSFMATTPEEAAIIAAYLEKYRLEMSEWEKGARDIAKTLTESRAAVIRVYNYNAAKPVLVEQIEAAKTALAMAKRMMDKVQMLERFSARIPPNDLAEAARVISFAEAKASKMPSKQPPLS